MAGDKPICFVNKGWEENGYPVDSNARLIAAAPDLLEALKDIVEVVPWKTDDERVLKAIAAITKAEGK